MFQLNSDWSDEFSTEVRAFYKDYKRGQDRSWGRGFAQFQVCTAPTSDRTDSRQRRQWRSTACAPGYATVSFGPDISRQSNSLTAAPMAAGPGRLTRDQSRPAHLRDYQDTKIYNLFVQRTAGRLFFDSLADFQAGNAQRLRYGNATPSLDPADGAAQFRYQSYAFGIQDNWRVTDWFHARYGVRYDSMAATAVRRSTRAS